MLVLHRRDRGNILLVAIVLIIVIMGLAASYLTYASVQSKRTAEGVEDTRSKTAAEDGIDHMRAYLLGVVDPNNPDDPASQWDTILSTNGGTPSWATNVQTPEGSYTVRVLDNNDGDGNLLDDLDGTVLLEAVGYGTKDITGPSHVIRCVVTLEVNDPTDNFAIITGGDLVLDGSEDVDGTLGSVHTNQDLTLKGSANVTQNATASETTTTIGDGTSVGGTYAGSTSVVPIAPVVPSDYRSHAGYILTADGRVLNGATGLEVYNFNTPPPAGSALPNTSDHRFAFLPDGRATIYAGFGMPSDRNANNAYGNSGGTNGSDSTPPGQDSTPPPGQDNSTPPADNSTPPPGQDIVIAPPDSGGSDVVPPDNGGGSQQASYNGFTWSAQNGWSTTTSGWVNGMYYLQAGYRNANGTGTYDPGNITFNHGGTDATPWDVTIVAEGSIEAQGNPYLTPYFNDVELFVAGEDVYLRGTGTNAQVEGLVAAHGEVDLAGNITFAGRFVAEAGVNIEGSPVDDTDHNDDDSPTDDGRTSSFSGSVHITYNGYMPRSLVTDYRLPVRSWQEDIPTNQGLNTLGNDTQVLNATSQGGAPPF